MESFQALSDSQIKKRVSSKASGRLACQQPVILPMSVMFMPLV